MIKIKFNNSDVFINVEFSKSDNIVTLKGNVPHDENGFKTYKLDGTPLGDFSSYDTIYRVLDDGVQFSNDGSIYVEPPKPPQIVSVSWNDENDREEFRPTELEVEVNNETITLSEDNNWAMEYPSDIELSVNFSEIEDYTLVANGTSATYTHECIPLPTIEERIETLEEAVCEIADAII